VDAPELRAEGLELKFRQPVEPRQVEYRVAAGAILQALPAVGARQSAVPVLGKDAESLQELLALARPRVRRPWELRVLLWALRPLALAARVELASQPEQAQPEEHSGQRASAALAQHLSRRASLEHATLPRRVGRQSQLVLRSRAQREQAWERAGASPRALAAPSLPLGQPLLAPASLATGGEPFPRHQQEWNWNGFFSRLRQNPAEGQ
jgi:hypothetical protein